MQFSGILGGFETHKKQFFEIFEAKEQKEKTVKYRKISGKYRKKSEIIGKNRTKEISVEISYRSPPISDISVEISEILFLACSSNGVNRVLGLGLCVWAYMVSRALLCL